MEHHGYRGLAIKLRYEITHGDYRPGQKLPSIIELAEHHGTTITTTLRALRFLAREGLLDIVQGRGTYIVGADDTGDGTPADKVERHLRKLITYGKRSDPIPSEKALAIAYGTMPDTVRLIRQQLVGEGLIRFTPNARYVIA